MNTHTYRLVTLLLAVCTLAAGSAVGAGPIVAGGEPTPSPDGGSGAHPALAHELERGGPGADGAEHDAVRFVRSPRTPLEQQATGSEIVAGVGGEGAHDRGFTGAGATVAIVDTGFDADRAPVADNVVATRDFTGDGLDRGSRTTRHGDGVAEIVATVAPDVKLVLVSVGSERDMVEAIEYVSSRDDVDLASMSLGYSGGKATDGTADLDRALEKSVRGGTPWFVSAGNRADGDHWNGTWRDDAGTGYHEFAGGDECMDVSGPLDVRLQWNDWPSTDQDYDLRVYDATGGSVDPRTGDLVASSTDRQGGSRSPTERVSVSGSGEYCLAIQHVDADGSADFDLFLRDGSDMEYASPERSMTVGSTARGVTAVGAVEWNTRELRSYSSRGPTVDGRQKPDIAAPDGTTVTAYDGGFRGTSAATPHAAGTAALLAGADPSRSGDEIVARLKATADDPVDGTPANAVGAGIVNASAAVPPPAPVRTDASPITAADEDVAAVAVAFDSAPGSGTVTVRLTDENGTTATGTAPLEGRETTVHVDASDLADGDVTVEAKTDDSWTNVGGYTAETATSKDTATPSVRTFGVVPTADGMDLAVETDQELDALAVDVDGASSRTLRLADFEPRRSGGDTVIYETTVDVPDGEYTVALHAAADEAGNDGADGERRTVAVGGPADVRVVAFEAPDRVAPGEPATVEATLRNVGGEVGTTTAAYRFDGTAVDERTVRLEPGERATVTMTYTPPYASAGTSVDHGVATDADSASRTVTVAEASTPPRTPTSTATPTATVDRGAPTASTGSAVGSAQEGHPASAEAEASTLRGDRSGSETAGPSGQETPGPSDLAPLAGPSAGDGRGFGPVAAVVALLAVVVCTRRG